MLNKHVLKSHAMNVYIY